MFLINLSVLPIFIIWAGIVIFLNVRGFLKKQSKYHAINLAISLFLLIIHMSLRDTLSNWNFNIICDMIFLAVSISFYLYVNDIETRRKVISEVFENRYKNRRKK
ncbi:MAG: hypothetical protein IJ220_09330 [Clostridia bacterium]|nr:hypothetical protein [Clostridia bacterium]